MDKQTEIKTLQSLKGDTYFNQFFNNHDIDQMCENIKNDFGIEMCCQFFQKEATLEKQIAEMQSVHNNELAQLKAYHDEEMKNFAKALIIDNDVDQTIEDKFGKQFNINTKYNAKQELSDDEIS